MIVHVPISVGELYDKITILRVKVARFDDETKRANVQRELAALSSVASAEVESAATFDSGELKELVALLQEINFELWDIEDGKRRAEEAGVFDAAFIQLARNVYLKNDRRAAIKKRINDLVGSTIVEEKSHKGANVAP